MSEALVDSLVFNTRTLAVLLDRLIKKSTHKRIDEIGDCIDDIRRYI